MMHAFLFMGSDKFWSVRDVCQKGWTLQTSCVTNSQRSSSLVSWMRKKAWSRVPHRVDLLKQNQEQIGGTCQDVFWRYRLFLLLVANIVCLWRQQMYELCATIQYQLSWVVGDSYVWHEFFYHFVQCRSRNVQLVVIFSSFCHGKWWWKICKEMGWLNNTCTPLYSVWLTGGQYIWVGTWGLVMFMKTTVVRLIKVKAASIAEAARPKNTVQLRRPLAFPVHFFFENNKVSWIV